VDSGIAPTNGTQTMNYVVTCLSSIWDTPLPGTHAVPRSPGLPELLASLPVVILEEQEEDGFTSALIKCDAATAATIAERYHISEV
jgi:hypothetical protein